ncbi:MAG: hypothetical protein SGPRY_006328 [Prymnesium sp.]
MAHCTSLLALLAVFCVGAALILPPSRMPSHSLHLGRHLTRLHLASAPGGPSMRDGGFTKRKPPKGGAQKSGKQRGKAKSVPKRRAAQLSAEEEMHLLRERHIAAVRNAVASLYVMISCRLSSFT